MVCCATYVIVLVRLCHSLEIQASFLDLLLSMLSIFRHDELDCPLVFLDRSFQLAILLLDLPNLRILLVDNMDHVLIASFSCEEV